MTITALPDATPANEAKSKRLYGAALAGVLLTSVMGLTVLGASSAQALAHSGWFVGLGLAGLVAIVGSGILTRKLANRADVATMVAVRAARTLDDLIDISNDACVEFDAEMRIVYISPRVEAMTGVPRETVIGLSIEQLRSDPANLESRTAFWQAVSERKPFRNIFAPIALPNGARFWVKCSGLPLHDANGGFTGYRCMAFAQPESEVRGSSQVHQERMQALGELTSGIAHDLNNLLAAVIGYSSLLKEDLGGDKEKLNLLQRVLSAGERASNVVERIHSFARLNPGETGEVDLGTAVRNAYSLLRTSLPAHTKLLLEDRTSGETVRIDPAKVDHLVANLCSNAKDAIAGNGGTISLSIGAADPEQFTYQLLLASKVTSPARYAVVRRLNNADWILAGHLHPDARYAQLTVSDTGTGIRPQALSRIFDPYFSTKTNAKATVGKGGLGLSVVHGIMLGVGGAIAVHTRKAEGTTFDLFLPVTDSKSEAPRR